MKAFERVIAEVSSRRWLLKRNRLVSCCMYFTHFIISDHSLHVFFRTIATLQITFPIVYTALSFNRSGKATRKFKTNE